MQGICRRPCRACRLSGLPPSEAAALILFLLLTLVVLAALAAVAVVLLGPVRRQRAVRELLDAADALEARLRAARAEIEAVAGNEGRDPVGDAMREMLRQRLWLREYGRRASLAQLAEVRSSIDAARDRIEQQLNQIERARLPTG